MKTGAILVFQCPYPEIKKSSVLWEGRTGSGSRGNDARKGQVFLNGGGRVGMLDACNGGPFACISLGRKAIQASG